MKKYLFLLTSTFLLLGCAEEYKPNGHTPENDASIEMFFADTVSGMPANVKLEFINDDAKSISATYGDNNEIFYQVILVEGGNLTAKEALEEYFSPIFNNYEKVKYNKEGFSSFVRNDTIEMATWFVGDYAFLMKCKIDYLDAAIIGSYFLEYK